MIQDIQLRVMPQIASDSSLVINYIAEEKGIDARTVKAIRIMHERNNDKDTETAGSRFRIDLSCHPYHRPGY